MAPKIAVILLATALLLVATGTAAESQEGWERERRQAFASAGGVSAYAGPGVAIADPGTGIYQTSGNGVGVVSTDGRPITAYSSGNGGIGMVSTSGNGVGVVSTDGSPVAAISGGGGGALALRNRWFYWPWYFFGR